MSREQRVTGTFVFIMVGLTVFLGKFLKVNVYDDLFYNIVDIIIYINVQVD